MLPISFWFFLICVVMFLYGFHLFVDYLRDWKETLGLVLMGLAVTSLLTGIFWRPSYVKSFVTREEDVLSHTLFIASANLNSSPFVIGDDQGLFNNYYVVYVVDADGKYSVQHYGQWKTSIIKDATETPYVEVFIDRATCLPMPAWLDFLLSCKVYSFEDLYVLHVPEDATVISINSY